MSSINENSLEKKFTSMTNTQDSVQTLSLWIIHHRAHHKKIVDIWIKVLKKSHPKHRLTLVYLANDVIQNSKRKGISQFVESFQVVLPDAIPLVRDNKIIHQIDRVLTIWGERTIYTTDFINDLKRQLKSTTPPPPPQKPAKNSSHAVSDNTPKQKVVAQDTEKIIHEFKPQKVIEKIRKVRKVEIDTATKFTALANSQLDATSTEVLKKLKDRAHGQNFQRDFDEAITCLEEYIKSLEKEVVERAEIIRLLEDAQLYYDSQNGEAKLVANAYKNFGNRVKNLKKKLEELIPTLPSPPPSPTVDAPSPTNSEDLELPGGAEGEIRQVMGNESPNSAPSPEGSPIGLSPSFARTKGKVPDIEEEEEKAAPVTASSGSTPTPGLTSFLPQAASVFSSWLDTLKGDKEQKSPTVSSSPQTAATGSGSLESRLSNLMQNMSNLPGSLFASQNSSSNTPRIDLQQNSNSPYATPKSMMTSNGPLELNENTPLKDEESGQGTPVLDENQASLSFLNKVLPAGIAKSANKKNLGSPSPLRSSPPKKPNSSNSLKPLASADTDLRFLPPGDKSFSLKIPTVNPGASASWYETSRETISKPSPKGFLAPPPMPPNFHAYLKPITTVSSHPDTSSSKPPDFQTPVENFEPTDMDLDDSDDETHPIIQNDPLMSGTSRQKSNLITLVQSDSPQDSPVPSRRESMENDLYSNDSISKDFLNEENSSVATYSQSVNDWKLEEVDGAGKHDWKLDADNASAERAYTDQSDYEVQNSSDASEEPTNIPAAPVQSISSITSTAFNKDSLYGRDSSYKSEAPYTAESAFRTDLSCVRDPAYTSDSSSSFKDAQASTTEELKVSKIETIQPTRNISPPNTNLWDRRDYYSSPQNNRPARNYYDYNSYDRRQKTLSDVIYRRDYSQDWYTENEPASGSAPGPRNQQYGTPNNRPNRGYYNPHRY